MPLFKKEITFHTHELQELQKSRRSKVKFKVIDELRNGRYKVELVQLQGSPLKLVRKSCGEERSKSLNREKNMLKEIDHENVVRIFAHSTSYSWAHSFTSEIFVEHCFLGNMKKYLRGVKRMSKALFMRQSKSLLRQMFDAVRYLHSESIFHGDLKPANMMVAGRLTLKLIDFEMAGKFEKGAKMFDGTTRGTTSFKSPECHLRMPRCPAKCDVWSLGVVMIVVYAGEYRWHRPDRGDREFTWFMERMEGGLRDGVKRLREEEKEVVMMCLRKDPDARSEVGEIVNTDWYKNEGDAL